MNKTEACIYQRAFVTLIFHQLYLFQTLLLTLFFMILCFVYFSFLPCRTEHQAEITQRLFESSGCRARVAPSSVWSVSETSRQSTGEVIFNQSSLVSSLKMVLVGIQWLYNCVFILDHSSTVRISPGCMPPNLSRWTWTWNMPIQAGEINVSFAFSYRQTIENSNAFTGKSEVKVYLYIE